MQVPEWPAFTEEKHHELPAGELREMVRRTVFAATEDGARYSMSGVLWELDENHARLVATDGRRLALADGKATPQGGHTTQGTAPIVPKKALVLLERNLQDDPDQVVKVSFRPNDVLFRTETSVLYSRLVEARFPDYNRVIPDKHLVRVPLQAATFLTAVRQAAIMADTETRRVSFKFDKNKLTLEAQGAMTGRSQVELAIDYKAKPITIDFNPAYVTDMIRVLPADAELNLDLIDGKTAALLRYGEEYRYLIMPLT
jgi:DNA polymerase-3 subunit beta